MCVSASLYSYSPQDSTLIIHLTPPLQGKKNHPFSIQYKITWVKKDPALVGITAMWNLIMWNRCSSGLVSAVRVKNPITEWTRNNQNTSSQSCCAFLLPLTPSHYSLPYSLIHLSEHLQLAASYPTSTRYLDNSSWCHLHWCSYHRLKI